MWVRVFSVMLMCVLYATAYLCLHILPIFCIVYTVTCRSNYKGSGGKLHFFLTPELCGDEWSNLRPSCFDVRKLPASFFEYGTHWVSEVFWQIWEEKSHLTLTELEPRLVQPSRYAEYSFARTSWHKIFQLHSYAFSWSHHYKLLYIFLQFVKIVKKNASCTILQFVTYCQKIPHLRSYCLSLLSQNTSCTILSLFPLSQNTSCTILQFITIVTKHFLHNLTVCFHCHKILPPQSYSLFPL